METPVPRQPPSWKRSLSDRQKAATHTDMVTQVPTDAGNDCSPAVERLLRGVSSIHSSDGVKLDKMENFTSACLNFHNKARRNGYDFTQFRV